LDALLGGGFPCSSLSLVYGEASTGKTTLAMHCAVECASQKAKVLFVDSDQSLSLVRLSQIATGHADEVAENILIFSPATFEEQTALIESLENYVAASLRLVIVDSITSLYRASLGPSANVFEQNRQLNRQLAYLAELAPKRELAILVTGHVHARPLHGDAVELVSHRLMTYWPSVILRLSLAAKNGSRLVALEKHFARDIAQKCSYRIADEGLVRATLEKYEERRL